MANTRFLPMLLAGLAFTAMAVPGGADGPGRDAALAKARAALTRGDGVAAEIAVKDAQSQGANRLAVAAIMGEALLTQGKQDKAREWLGPAQFAPGDAGRGLRMLARLEQAQGNDAAASAALDRALKLDPNNAEAWVDLAQLRYRKGEQLQAASLAERALAADPANLRALNFRGLMVRDQFGPEAALVWFEAALLKAPNDGVLLGDYAATLGELGRYKQMLVVTRKMLELGVAAQRAYFLQAVMAARAGNLSLARARLNRIGKAGQTVPAAQLLSAVIDLEGGNANLAVETLVHLAKAQPQNEAVQQLLARAMYAAGQQKELIARFSGLAQSQSAPPYMLTLVARAHEDLGQRDAAAPLLDRAAAANRGGLTVAFDLGGASAGAADQAAVRVRLALAEGRGSDALGIAERLRSDWPGMGSAHALAGDAQFAAGNYAAASQRYAEAARVRSDDNLMVRMALSAALDGHRAAGAQLAAGYLAGHPQSDPAKRLAADYAASIGDWGRARLLLENLRAGSGASDVRLLTDLSYAQLRLGDSAQAEATARTALALQRANPVAAQALAMALKARRQEPELAEALARRAARP